MYKPKFIDFKLSVMNRGKRGKIPRTVILTAVFVFLACNFISFYVFDHIPHIHDEMCYLFQAKLFISGKLFAPSPCAKEFFDFPHMINNGRWYSIYTPGWPVLLATGAVSGIPWVVNPLLAAASIFLFYFLGREMYNARIGILAALLGGVSIWFLLISASMMSHTSSLLFSALFLLSLFRSLKNPSLNNGIVLGAALGVCLLIRPYNAVIFSLPFLIFYGFHLSREIKPRLKNTMAFMLTLSAFIGILLLYNQLTNGSPFKMGYVVFYGKGVLPGFGHSGLLDLQHTVLLGHENIGAYLMSLNEYLFGWPLTSFWALLPLLFFSKTNAGERKKDLLLASGIISMLLGLYIYWATFVVLGARLMFETASLLILLSARGIFQLNEFFLQAVKKSTARKIQKILVFILIIFTGYAFFVRFPRWVWPKDTEYVYKTLGRNFAGATSSIHRTICSLGVEQAVVVMKFLYYPTKYFPSGNWNSGFLFNDPDLKEEIIYANSMGAENIRLFDCFPDRKIYLYLGTVERGLLVPLKRDENAVRYGTPLLSSKKGRSLVELVDDPKRIFKLYSQELESFLDKLYLEYDWATLDSTRFVELGMDYRSKEDFLHASFCFELALQIDKNPEERRSILNQLLPCYRKLGNISDAKKIEARMAKILWDEKILYFINPEKGY